MRILEIVSKLENENQNEILKIVLNDAIVFCLRVIMLFILFYVGKKVINFILDRVDRFSQKSIDEGARQFSKSFLKLLLYVFMVLIALLILGFDKHSLVTMVSAIGLGVGISLKDFLSNLAGGVVILFTQPFKVGEYIEIKETLGKVYKIEVFSTHINTLDSKRVIIPNNFILSNLLTNHDANPDRQIELNIPISYESDHLKAVAILEDLCKTFEGLEHEKNNFVNIMNYGDSSVNILLLVWAKREGYYRVLL